MTHVTLSDFMIVLCVPIVEKHSQADLRALLLDRIVKSVVDCKTVVPLALLLFVLGDDHRHTYGVLMVLTTPYCDLGLQRQFGVVIS